MTEQELRERLAGPVEIPAEVEARLAEACARAVAPAKAMATGSVQPVATFSPAAIASRSTCIVC